jgi:hypothetical protein
MEGVSGLNSASDFHTEPQVDSVREVMRSDRKLFRRVK